MSLSCLVGILVIKGNTNMNNSIIIDYVNETGVCDTQAFPFSNKPLYSFVEEGDYKGLHLDYTTAIVYDKDKTIQPIFFRKLSGKWMPQPDQYDFVGDE